MVAACNIISMGVADGFDQAIMGKAVHAEVILAKTKEILQLATENLLVKASHVAMNVKCGAGME